VPGSVARRPKDGKGPLVVCAGVLHQIKGLETLLSAFRIFSGRHIGARLVIVGLAIRHEVAAWRRRARELAPTEDVEVTGWVPERRYRELLASADLAVQLRRFSNGEASASVCDCIAAGVPTVVSDVAWYSELPEDTVVRVPVDAPPTVVAQAMTDVIGDGDLRRRLEDGQRRFAHENSFARAAEAMAEQLAL
jgi:glycosyltransferase involved in cell wall biosynthesis